jgi:hypothetical protein
VFGGRFGGGGARRQKRAGIVVTVHATGAVGNVRDAVNFDTELPSNCDLFVLKIKGAGSPKRRCTCA